MKRMSDYVDKHGLVTQLNGDGGDSFNRTPIVLSLSLLSSIPGPVIYYLRLALRDAFVLLDYRRHIDPWMWYSRHFMISRDQLVGMLASLVLIGDTQLISCLIRKHWNEGKLFLAWNRYHNHQWETEEQQLEANREGIEHKKWNGNKTKFPDATLFEVWALYIRGLKLWYLYPLLYLFDLENLAGSIKHRVFPYKIKWRGWKPYLKPENDVINHVMTTFAGILVWPTLWTKLSARVCSPNQIQGRLDAFFGEEKEPPINDLIYPMVYLHFGK